MHGVIASQYGVNGWPIVGWCSLLLGALIGALGVLCGVDDHGLHVVIRTTAQTSFALFTSAFTAAALATLWPLPLTRWLRRNRRYLGVSFAVSHFLHLAVILTLLGVAPDFQISTATLIGGGTAYVFIAAMTATSFDRTAAWIGPRAWRRLHTTGVYYIWFIFFISYAPRAAHSPAYVPFALIVVAAVGLRVAAYRRQQAPATLRVAAR